MNDEVGNPCSRQNHRRLGITCLSVKYLYAIRFDLVYGCEWHQDSDLPRRFLLLPLKYFPPFEFLQNVLASDCQHRTKCVYGYTINICNLSIPRLTVTVFSSPIHLTRSQGKRLSRLAPLFLAGHLALDFLNTRMRVDGKIVDDLQRDQDVLHWLQQAWLFAPKAGPHATRTSY